MFRAHNLVGYVGEVIVLLLCKVKLQKVLHHRYRSPAGEVDLIAQRKQELFFIEVKTSLSSRFSEIPISSKQRASIVRTAKYFLAHNPQFAEYQISFDAYCISPKNGISHFKNAWQE
ncbi:MAG: YraN family protein [Anaplasma sp.]